MRQFVWRIELSGNQREGGRGLRAKNFAKQLEKGEMPFSLLLLN